MISISENISNMLGRPVRHIQARVELYECSALQHDDYNRTLLDTFPADGALIDFKIERIADDGKFFGFGVCQKLTVKLRDKERAINIVKDQVFEVSFGVNGEYTYPCPLFRIEEVSRDENTNDLTITAYDFLYKAGEHRVSELGLTDYTMKNFIYACADVLSLPVKFNIDESIFDLYYPTGANLDGTETLRQALNMIADATQTIFFVDWDWRLTFKRLDKDAAPAWTIGRSNYFELKNKSDRTLTTVCHATELGDNLEVSTGQPGVVQYVRNNAFWELREDITTLLNNALAASAGITISQFDCSWRGNFALEIGDKISIETKSGEMLTGYVLNDTLIYNGGLKEQTFWNFTEHTAETAANPVNLGEALKQTYAKVDKVNKTIELYVGETESKIDEVNQTIIEKAAEIKLTTDSITSRVEATETSIQETNTTINEKFAEIDITTDAITSRVEATETRLDNADDEIETVKQSMSSVEQTAASITARVEEAERKVNEATGEVETIKENMSSIEQTSSEIVSQVSAVETLVNVNADTTNDIIASLEERLNTDLSDIDTELITLKNSVETRITQNDFTIKINEVLATPAESVKVVDKDFRFDKDGLTIADGDSSIQTNIDINGMTVSKGNKETGEKMLTATADGVEATNLKATTWLIIGKSKFQDYGENRSGCFWIGG